MRARRTGGTPESVARRCMNDSAANSREWHRGRRILCTSRSLSNHVLEFLQVLFCAALFLGLTGHAVLRSVLA